ncbi:uncharacterized protein F5891DRAFT_324864 [Suillus fuscotomentosus]|uniref:Heterokaryon incompatibility domain-containing protein n=1 Tax=Suillus fuscotomentosus TaxID=1912939 RepID=A0AAD4E5U6_9AGAM|nr:uncharacterized protein F5891DRAFT_324864 [Suillus fuscotomentosus]KAG1900216.1 hypothetical protein F5891DRAFT_324864 [Suillus fuscotomentosus]
MDPESESRAEGVHKFGSWALNNLQEGSLGLITFREALQAFQPVLATESDSQLDLEALHYTGSRSQPGAGPEAAAGLKSADDAEPGGLNIEMNSEEHDLRENVLAKAPLRLYDCENEVLKDQQTYLQETGHTIPPYLVVSQVWGEIKHQMILPTIEWPVAISDPAKWDTILAYCKAGKRVKWMWMDAICINQSNSPEADEEKAVEIPKMNHYYRGATACLVVPSNYLNFPLAHAQLVDLSCDIMDVNASVQDNAPRIWESIAVLDAVIGDEWFWRVWTYQEFLLPNKHILPDGQELRVDLLRRLLDWYHKILRNGSLKKPQGGTDYNFIHPGKELVISVPRNWQTRNLRFQMKEELEQNGHVNLISLIWQISHRQSMYPVDRLLGLYGLLSDEEKVPINPSGASDHNSSTAALESMWERMMAKAIMSGRVWPLLHDSPEPDAVDGKHWMPHITAPNLWNERFPGAALAGLHPETLHHHNQKDMKIADDGLHIAVRFVGCVMGMSTDIGDGGGEMNKITFCTWFLTANGCNTDPIIQQLQHGLATSDMVASNEIQGSQEALFAALHASSLHHYSKLMGEMNFGRKLTYGNEIMGWNKRVLCFQIEGHRTPFVVLAWIHCSSPPKMGDCWIVDVTSEPAQTVRRWIVVNKVGPKTFRKIGTVRAWQPIGAILNQSSMRIILD